MTCGRRVLKAVGLVCALALVVGADMGRLDAAARGGVAIVAQGESPTRTNVATASDSRASGGAYLALHTAETAPEQGWFATYTVHASTAGVYRLDAVLTPPATPDADELGGSPFGLSVNDGPFAQVAFSQPRWAEAAVAWGALVRTRLADIELRRGANTITFRVDERRVSAAPPVYHLFLDRFTLTPTPVALTRGYLGDPAANVGIYRGDEPAELYFRLNGRTDRPQRVNYRVTDYFSAEVAAGSTTVPAGAATATVDLPELPPGNYRSTASLVSAPSASVTGYFAHLPELRAVAGPANRFGVTTSAAWAVPSSRLDAVAAAVKEMGAGYVREEVNWPVLEPARGRIDTSSIDRVAQAFAKRDVKTLGALWTVYGNTQAPAWAMTETSAPLPADLRDGYRFANHLAGQARGIGADALELWNEPDVDVIGDGSGESTGDQHAAYLKAAALGVADHPDRPLVSLSGIAFPGPFQDVMLQNGVARYGDVWAFHGYPDYVAGGLSTFPPHSVVEHELARLYDASAQLWMTESGIFVTEPGATALTDAQQVDQARYLVQSTVQDLATGTDKHFWFAGTPYWGFGLLNREFQPLPSYSAHAAMASILGEANVATQLRGLPANVSGYVFTSGGQAVTVLWAAAPTRVTVPLPGSRAEVYDIMGVRRQSLTTDRAGGVGVTASLDPIYVVSDSANGLPATDHGGARPGTLSVAEHIVLSQRYAANAQPAADLPLAYSLGRSTRMSVDVYNFNQTPRTVTLAGKAFGGWSVQAAPAVRVPANGRVSVPVTITASGAVRPGVEYPMIFDATVDGEPVPPSVARISRKGEPGAPIPLEPTISDIVPGSGTTGPSVAVSARIADGLSGVADAAVEVDGRPVPSHYDSVSGRLTADLQLSPGQHQVRIRASNHAHARVGATIDLTVR